MTPRAGELRAEVTVRREAFEVAATLELEPGGRLAVLGPNGSGKSTLLAALAGLVPLSSGRVLLDGRVLEQAGAVRRGPEERRIGLLDQKPRLFPHLTAAQNVAFGPRARGAGRAAALVIAHDWLDRVGLADRGEAAPHELSGGQQQRVAIARAFAAEPHVILLDEPFSALDAESAPVVRRLLSAELSRTGTSAVLVTHDLADAWQLADDCVVLHEGRVVERGSPAELAARPKHPFTARLSGFSVVEGRWTGDALDVGDGIRLPGRTAEPIAPGEPAFAAIAPQDVVLVTSDAPKTDAETTFVLSAVSSQAGALRLEHHSGLALVTAVEMFEGRPLPRVGDRVRVRPGPVTVQRAPRTR
ncbi:sulfate/molybdate ABC transporter ATP-binding protein [Microbacterium sp. CIAB417]|uniref:sulfate/molybdate ABC transporter ATP-binding protein n=1 Tax=Microbacterium sp. CIAB417 TaxID=2860287 RepID=UPI001FAC1126|nr:ABC transporter ATP-binding protein [Microbacterium sp. CIAB417]